MNNKETFVEKLNICGEVKYEMCDIDNRIMSSIKSVYGFIFKREKKDFVSLKNMMYFKGGVASPDARPKLHEFLDGFIKLVSHYDFLGDDEIKTYLSEHGVDIEITQQQIQDGPASVSKEDTKNFERSWNFSMNNQKAPETKKELLNAILDRAVEIQHTIQDKKEEIEKGAEEVKIDCQIKKSFFMKALGIKVTEIKKKSVDNEIVKIEDDIQSSRDIISLFDENKQNESSEEEQIEE